MRTAFTQWLVDLTSSVFGILPVANGGSGASSLTDHSVLVGSGTSAVTPIPVGTNGTVLAGSTGADPSFTDSPIVTTSYATTFDTNVAAAGVTLSGTTLAADGTDGHIDITITPNGSGAVRNMGTQYVKGAAAVTSFAGTVSSSGTTVTFSSAADAKIAGWRTATTDSILGTTIVAAGLTRYITAWTNATTCTVDTAPFPAWSGTTITSAQLPLSVWIKSDGSIGAVELANGNVGIGTTTFGTSAAKVLAMGSGTAPTTSPADAAQVWVADKASGADKAALHMRDEAGNSGPVAFAQALIVSHSASENVNAYDMYGSEHLITGAYTVTLPAAVVGMKATFTATTAAVFSVDCNGADQFILAGTALTAGNKITSPGTAYDSCEVICLTANKWTVRKTNAVFVDGGA